MTSLVAKASGSTEFPVVVTSHTLRLLPAMMNELADALADQFPARCNRVRLVAWNSGCLHDDRPAPAYQLATRLGVEVIAPAGPLLGVPGGSLFAAAGRGAQRPGGWWRFAPGSAPSRVGWRYPAPHWDPDLGEVGDLGNDLVVEQVPAGLWLHRSGYRSMTDLVYSVPVDPDDPALIVSHPDEKPLQRDELARALAILPRRTAERLIFTPYGPEPVADGRLGEVAASLLGAPTRARTGLPLYGSGGQRALVTIDADGRPRWRPFVHEQRFDPRASSVEPTDWVNPVTDLLSQPVAPATFALGGGWVAEMIEAGIWIRPAQATESADWARTLPLDVDECTVVVGAPTGGYLPPPADLVTTLLEHLPADARPRVRFAVPRGAGDDVMRLATVLTEQLPAVAEIRVIPSGGRRRAHAAPEAPSRASHALREPTPYPPQPVYQPTPTPAPSHAARQLTPPVQQPTPYPPQPLYQPTPTPPPSHAARELTPPSRAARELTTPSHAARELTPSASAVRELTPPPSHAARELTPPPSHAARELTPPPSHAARELTPPPSHAVREVPSPALRQPTPYPPQPVYQPTPTPPSGPPAPSGRQLTPPVPAPASYPAPQPAPAANGYPVQPADEPARQASYAVREPLSAPTRPRRKPGPPMGPPSMGPPSPPMAPPRGGRQPGYGAYQPAGPQATRPPLQQPSAPSGRPARQPNGQPVPGAHQPNGQPRGARQPNPAPISPMPTSPMPHPVHQPMAQPVHQPTPPPMPAVHQPTPPPMPALREPAREQAEDPQELLQRTEIRSHRTSGTKSAKAAREEGKADTSELNRLLGFFDEIRKARAWDEQPAGTRPGA
ncbi:hypothetical protein [Planosporangium mesophilum]|nr:hypothetical protein [Planosporangium mesophilum]NJC86124.1 hypothetical protein [Planosporangium mesophilum]